MDINYIFSGLYESVEAFFICCGVLVLVANISVSFGELSFCQPTFLFLTDLLYLFGYKTGFSSH